MCYSAQIWADFKKYQRLGGELDVKAFMKMAGWTRTKGSWIRTVPKALRASLIEARDIDEGLAKIAAVAEEEGIAAITVDMDVQITRLAQATSKLASKPTKKAENDARVATNKIAAARSKLEEIAAPPPADGVSRIWPGHFAPVLIREPETGDRLIVPMRYRCRLPGWTAAEEAEKPGTYNARRDKLTTVWRRVFGVHHGVIAVDRFYESVRLNDLQQRQLAPGEREQNLEIEFKPQSGEDLYIACLYTHTEASGDEPGFYSFAVITGEPPTEVALAGHDRCIVSLREEDIEAWLRPVTHSTGELQTLLDRGELVRPYFEHEMVA